MLKNGLLLVVTLIITTLLSEVIVRQVFHPVDYLLPKTETDQFLGHRISSGSGGHDDWGFRNYSIPQKTQIVAIGDSQTYGTMATHKESWPAHLSNSLNTQVYNLALGGYGPIQYLYLLESLALKLEPEVVIIALYYGNDLFDAYRAAYSNPNWARFKNPDLSKQKVEKIAIGGGTLEHRLLGDLRGWMASNSVLYRLSTQSFLGNFVREMEFLSRDTEIIDIELKGVRLFFSPEYRLSALDRQSQMVQEGLRISKAAFNEIHSLSMPHNIRLVVVAIPTKERVYEDFLIDVLKEKIPKSLEISFENEKQIHAEFEEFFEGLGIQFVDALPGLKKAAGKGQAIYPVNDGHPNGYGYSIIAEQIEMALH